MQIPKLVAKGLVIIAIPAMFQLFFGISLALMESRAEKAQHEERHSKEVLLVLGKVESCCYDISLNIIRLTVEKSVRIIKQLNATKEALDGHQKALTTLVSTDPKQSENAKELKTVLSSFLEGTERIIDDMKDNDQTAFTIVDIQSRWLHVPFEMDLETLSAGDGERFHRANRLVYLYLGRLREETAGHHFEYHPGICQVQRALSKKI